MDQPIQKRREEEVFPRGVFVLRKKAREAVLSLPDKTDCETFYFSH